MDHDISVGLFSLSTSSPVPYARHLFRRQLTCPTLPTAFQGPRDIPAVFVNPLAQVHE
jgi:hypothetical protein